MSGEGSDARHEMRYAVGVDAPAGTADTGEDAVSVTNLSASGCRLTLGHRLPVGATVSISAGGVKAIAGEVKWQVDEAHGVQFDQTLTPDALQQLRSALSEQPAYISVVAAGQAGG